MNNRWERTVFAGAAAFWMTLALSLPGTAAAQVPVDESGAPLTPMDQTAGQDSAAGAADEELPLLSQAELEELVGRVALYPDKLLAIVLPASTYPLQIVQAARFLERLEEDSSLEPPESWEDSVTALLNYPEVVEMMNEDIDWTWRLGEAVIQQQADVVAAVEKFRDRAYAAGNLKTDRRQTVTSNDNGAIEIQPLEEDIIYVPYYEPEHVVHYQPRQVYYYYPRPYPVYYYPYPRQHTFLHGYFWGVTTAFQIGWATDHLHVFHSSYWGHPYYGRHYFGHYYRRPSISIYNSYYANDRHRHVGDRHRVGDYWQPRHDGGARPGHYRARMERFREARRERTTEGYRQANRSSGTALRGDEARHAQGRQTGVAARRGFAASPDNAAHSRQRTSEQARRSERDASGDRAIRFRPRERAGNGTTDAARSAAQGSNHSIEDRGRDNSEIRFRSRSNALRNRDPSPDSAAAAPRGNATTQRVQPQRSATPRATAPSRSAPRATPPSRSTPRTTAPARTSTPRRSPPRASAPARSAPPAAKSRAAPAPSSRSAPARRDSGNGSRRSSQQH